MRYSNSFVVCLAALASLFLSTACGGDSGPSKQEKIQKRLQTNMRSFAEPIQANQRMLENAKLTDDYFGGSKAGSLETSETGSTTISQGLTDSNRSESNVQRRRGSRSQSQNPFARIFNDQNLESQTGDTLTYRMPADAVCSQDRATESVSVSGEAGTRATDNESDGDSERVVEPAQQDSESCRKMVQAVQPRIQITLGDGSKITIAMLISPDKYEVFALESSKKRLALTSDLGEVKGAVESINSAISTEDDKLDVPQTLDGTIELVVERLGPKKASLGLEVPEAIEVKTEDGEFSLAKSVPLLEMVGDGSAKTINLTSEAGASKLKLASWFGMFESASETVAASGESEGPAVSEDETPVPSEEESSFLGDIEIVEGETVSGLLSMEGSSIDATFDVESETITVSEISSGLTLKLDGKKVLEHVVKGTGKDSFEVVFEAAEQAEDAIKATFDPGLDIETTLQFNKIQDKLKSNPDWILDEVLNVSFEGSSKPALLLKDQPEADDSLETGNDGGENGAPEYEQLFEVLNGTFTLEGAKSGITHEAQKGKCLFAKSEVEDTAHPFEAYKADTCE